ncbi:MAG: hypothetical protein JWQ94_4784 [Tardiphaga sp.]|nr:hypothetical protein [Tardiphaga sp.]
MSFPALSSSIALGALIAWMLALTVKHVIADFFLQNAWMAIGKDQKTGWALPLLAHVAIHGVLTTLLVAAVQPKLWFVGLIDFAIHLCIDRLKGVLVSSYCIAPGHPWFWWLLGIDQALHHVTDFGLAILLVANS